MNDPVIRLIETSPGQAMLRLCWQGTEGRIIDVVLDVSDMSELMEGCFRALQYHLRLMR